MKRIVIGLLALIIIGGGIGLIVRSRANRGSLTANVQTAQVARGDVRLTVTADGVLRPLTTVLVKSYAGGRVEELAVDVGDRVKKGDLIAKIDPTDSQTTYLQALADLRVAEARVAQAEQQAKAQKEFTRADIAQAGAGYNAAVKDVERLREAAQPQTRAQARAALDKALAGLEAATKDLERLQQATQPQARAQAKAAVDKAQAALAVATKDLEALQQATQPQTQAQARATLDKALAGLEAATKDLAALQYASQPQARAQARAALDTAAADLRIAEKELARTRGLREAGFVPQSDLDTAQTRVDVAQAALDSAEERWRTIEAQQTAELEAAQARVEQAKAELAAAQKRWNTLEAEQRSELEAAQARVEQAKADLASANERWSTLECEQTAEIEAAQAKVAQAKADLIAAQQRWETLNAEQETELAAAQARGTQARAGYDRALADVIQERLKQADLASARAQVARQQAQVQNAKTMLEYCTITAPRDGVILQKFVEEGTIITSGRSAISAGTDIVELGDLSEMFVDVSLDEADVAKVRVGQPVEITVEALPDKLFLGEVERVDPQATTQQNIATVLVTVHVDNPDPLLRPEMTASCSFLVDEVKDCLYLPSRAVKEVSGTHMVTIVEHGQLVDVPVEVGLEGDESTEILEGLREGVEVVVPTLGRPTPAPGDRAREFGRRAGGMSGFVRSS